MNKRYLFSIGMLIIGCSLLLILLIRPGFISFGIVSGLAGGFIGVGLQEFVRTRSDIKNGKLSVDQRRIELEIIRNDERKIMIRDKAGKVAYIIGMLGLLMITLTLFLLNERSVSIHISIIIIVLACYVILEYIIGIIIFQIMDRKL